MKQLLARLLCILVSLLLLAGGGALIYEQRAVSTTPKTALLLIVTGTASLLFCVYVGPRLKSVTFPKGGLELDAANTKIADTIADSVADKLEPKIQSIAEQGTYYFDNTKAFHDLAALIERSAEKHENVDLRLIAVAMRFSAPFIRKQLIPIMAENRDVHFKLRLAVVSPAFMEQFELDTLEFDWVKCSRELPAYLDSIRHEFETQGLTKVTLEVFYFDGVPPWHGFLLNCEHLFLGRTDWDWDTSSSNPRLSVGNNQYRYYGKATEAGDRRIKLFRHWFTWYSKFRNLRRSREQIS